MEKLFVLLELQRRAQEAATRQSFIHIVVNETHKLVPYKQAIFWAVDGQAVKLEKVSGNAVLDDKAPYALSVIGKIRSVIEAGAAKNPYEAFEYEGRQIVVLPFRTAEDGVLGGLWLERDMPFPDPELHLLEELAVTYAHAFALLSLRSNKNLLGSLGKNRRKLRKYLLAALLITALFPVRLSITAPAEIVAQDSDVVTIPFDGMIETVHVRPGDIITKGQLLVTMENSALIAQMDMARQELKAIQSSMARVSRESLAAPAKKGDLTALEAEIETKKIQYEYAEDMQGRSEIRAARDGVAVFSDAHILQGQPVSMGARIMMIADESKYDLLVRIPVDAMLPIDKDSSVSFYMNVSPLSAYTATIKSIGYQASPDPDGLLTYKVQAVPEETSDLRIGWKGTARISGEWTVLSYSILRRPLIALRRMTGW